jgi:hypothetical protein
MASSRSPTDLAERSEVWMIFFAILFLLVWQLLFPRCGIH